MMSCMPEVPESAIPAAAWGISCRAVPAEEIAGQDPFRGHGLRLEGAPGRVLSVDDVHEGTGMAQVVLYGGGEVIWVRLGQDDNGADVMSRWQAWLAQEGVTDST
jgi:hypothetical protein